MRILTTLALLSLLPLWLGWYNPFKDPLRAKTEAGTMASREDISRNYQDVWQTYGIKLYYAVPDIQIDGDEAVVRYRLSLDFYAL